MNAPTRILAFGSVSGFFWAIVAGFLADRFEVCGISPTLISGIISGIVTSAIFSWLVSRLSEVKAALVGILSLPFGAFIFGFSVTVLSSTGSPRVALNLAVNLALLSVVSTFAVVLIPLAVGTTLALRSIVVRPRGSWAS